MSDFISDTDLVARASALAVSRQLSPTVRVGSVGCALVTDTGAIYVGVCIDANCGIGFCAEHAAIAGMIAGGESRIRVIVAARKDGTILSPCGRCRELIHQVDAANAETRILLSGSRSATLGELLPEP